MHFFIFGSVSFYWYISDAELEFSFFLNGGKPPFNFVCPSTLVQKPVRISNKQSGIADEAIGQ